MTTLAAPITGSATAAAGLGYSYIFAAERAALALQDRVDFASLGLVSLRGDVAGSGSDTLRITEIDNVGFSRRFSAMGSETDPLSPQSISMAYSDVTVAQYSLAHSQTFNSQVIDRRMGHDIRSLMGMVPDSWAATVRYQACVAGAAISGVIGSATTELDVDSWLALAAAVRETPGAAALGAPRVTLAPQQLTQIIEAFRSEPAYGNSVADFTSVQGLVGQVVPNFAGMGMDVVTTADVVQSGGAYQGFAGSPGFMGWARASTGNIQLTGVVNPMYLPDFGLVVAELASSVPNSVALYGAWLWMGIAVGSSNLFYSTRVRSVV